MQQAGHMDVSSTRGMQRALHSRVIYLTHAVLKWSSETAGNVINCKGNNYWNVVVYVRRAPT